MLRYLSMWPLDKLKLRIELCDRLTNDSCSKRSLTNGTKKKFEEIPCKKHESFSSVCHFKHSKSISRIKTSTVEQNVSFVHSNVQRRFRIDASLNRTLNEHGVGDDSRKHMKLKPIIPEPMIVWAKVKWTFQLLFLFVCNTMLHGIVVTSNEKPLDFNALNFDEIRKWNYDFCRNKNANRIDVCVFVSYIYHSVLDAQCVSQHWICFCFGRRRNR